MSQFSIKVCDSLSDPHLDFLKSTGQLPEIVSAFVVVNDFDEFQKFAQENGIRIGVKVKSDGSDWIVTCDIPSDKIELVDSFKSCVKCLECASPVFPM